MHDTMKSLKEFPEHQFRAGLTPERLRPLQAIQAGLGMGIVVLSAVLLILAFGTTPPEPEDAAFELMEILTAVHVLLLAVLVPASGWLFKIRFTSKQLQRAGERNAVSDDPVDQALSIIRTAWIMRMAMLEAGALIGIMVCLIGILNGTILSSPEFALNGLSPLLFLFFVALTFPTSERITDVFRGNITSS